MKLRKLLKFMSEYDKVHCKINGEPYDVFTVAIYQEKDIVSFHLEYEEETDDTFISIKTEIN